MALSSHSDMCEIQLPKLPKSLEEESRASATAVRTDNSFWGEFERQEGEMPRFPACLEQPLTSSLLRPATLLPGAVYVQMGVAQDGHHAVHV